MNTIQKGNLSQAFCTAILMRYCQVLLPFGEGSRYDMAIDWEGKIYKLQVKTGCLNSDESLVTFNTCSNNKGYKRKAYSEEVDLIAVYCDKNERMFLVPISVVGVSSSTIRLKPTKNNQKSNVLFASSFEVKSKEDVKRIVSLLGV